MGAKNANTNPARKMGGKTVRCTLTVAIFISLIFRAMRAEINWGTAIKIANTPAMEPTTLRGAPSSVKNKGSIVDTSLKANPIPQQNS